MNFSRFWSKCTEYSVAPTNNGRGFGNSELRFTHCPLNHHSGFEIFPRYTSCKLHRSKCASWVAGSSEPNAYRYLSSFKTAAEPAICPKVLGPRTYLTFHLSGSSAGFEIIATYQPTASNPRPVFDDLSWSKKTMSRSLTIDPCPGQNHPTPGALKNACLPFDKFLQ